MSSGDIQRATIQRLIEEHREAGSVPVEKLVALIKMKEPRKIPSDTGLYIVRLYDGFDYCWMDVSKAVPWEEAVALWNEKTEGGMKNTRYGDIDYYAIYPSDTRMVHNSENSER